MKNDGLYFVKTDKDEFVYDINGYRIGVANDIFLQYSS